jgi:hypothetical protein
MAPFNEPLEHYAQLRAEILADISTRRSNGWRLIRNDEDITEAWLRNGCPQNMSDLAICEPTRFPGTTDAAYGTQRIGSGARYLTGSSVWSALAMTLRPIALSRSARCLSSHPSAKGSRREPLAASKLPKPEKTPLRATGANSNPGRASLVEWYFEFAA